MAVKLEEILVRLRAQTREFERKLRRSRRAMRRLGDAARDMQRRVAATFAALTVGVGLFVRSVTKAASTSENLRLRLNALLGSAEEGGKAFKKMSEFAATVPFSFEEIMASATQLAGIVKDGADEIAGLMPMIADLAAVSGLTMDQTTQQIVRAFSAGIGSADLFRERGITAMLGFQAGVTASAEESKRKIIAAWLDTGSQFRGASEKMASTWTGIVSMLGDRWFQFRNLVADAGMFDAVKSAADSLVKKLDEMSKSGELQRLATAMSKVGEAGIRALGAFVEGAGKAIGAITTNPLIAEAGLLGYLLLGKKGLVVGALLGRLVDDVLKELHITSRTAIEEQKAHLDELQKQAESLRNAINMRERGGNPMPEILQGAGKSAQQLGAELKAVTDQIHLANQAIRLMETGKLDDGLTGVAAAGQTVAEVMIALGSGMREFTAETHEAATATTNLGTQLQENLSAGGGPFAGLFQAMDALQRYQQIFAAKPTGAGTGGPWAALFNMGNKLQRVRRILGGDMKDMMGDMAKDVGRAATTLGQSFIFGIIDGVNDATSLLKQALKAVVSIMIAQIAGPAGLGILSPSREGIKLGDFFGQGLVAGIKGQLSNVAMASAGMSRAAVAGASPMSFNLNVDASGLQQPMTHREAALQRQVIDLFVETHKNARNMGAI